MAKYQRSPYLLVSHVTEEQVHICAPPKAPMPAQLSSIPSSPSQQQPTITHWVSHKSIVFALLSDGSLEGVDVESNQTQDYPATTQTLAASVLGLLADDLTVIGLVTNGLILWDRSSIKPPRLVNLPVQISSPLAPEFCSLLPDNQILLVCVLTLFLCIHEYKAHCFVGLHWPKYRGGFHIMDNQGYWSW